MIAHAGKAWGSIIRAGARIVLLALGLGALWIGFRPMPAAWGEDVMKFEPVPAESVSAVERGRAERRARAAARHDAVTPPDSPDHPDVPEPPQPPEPPEPPEVTRAGDVVRIGSDIHIEKGQVIEGDVFALRGNIIVDGHVKGNVAATGGDVTLGSTARIDGDVMCIGGKLEEEEGARVLGQRVTALRSGRDRARIEHAFREHELETKLDDSTEKHVRHLSFALSWLVVSLLLAWGIGKFAPARSQVTVDSLRQEPGLSLAIGLGLILMLVPSVVALALVVAILCITIIGIPLALGALVAYAGLIVVLALWGYVVGVMPLGQRVAQRMGRPASPVQMAVFGVLLISGLRVLSEILHFIPLFGWLGKLLWVVVFLVAAVATIMGAGALVRTKFGQGRDGRWWPLFTPARPTTPAPSESGPPPPPTPPAPPPAAPPTAGPGEPSPAA